jgi:DNA-binding CsgD family transcriptional regulator
MYAYFDQAIDAAKEDPDIFSIVSVWSVYGTCAWWLGNIEQAKTCLEQALLVSRQYHLTWSIPHLCLMYSELLFAMGRYGTAYEYLLDALAYDAQTPLMDVSFASVGIQVALYMKDEAALKKCIRPSVIEFAFRSGQPLLIGNIASAFAKWYIAYGHEHEAEALLHRAITTIDCRNSGVDFLIAVARYGRLSDVPRARIFWASRALRPCAGFFQASLALFDALVAQRRGNYAGMRSYAIDAMERCEALGLHDYVDLARTLLPAAMKIESTALLDDKPFTRVPALTIREQQVAELVLKGMTNQAIANALSITENTIEKHVASVMNKLGIRSRYQLADVLAHAEAEKRFGNRLG